MGEARSAECPLLTRSLQVLDELLTQLDSIRRKAKCDSIIDRNAAWASLSSLAALIRSAKRAIILDANAATSQVLIEFLHHCVAPESIRWRCLSNSASGSDIRRVQFVFGYDRKTGGNSCVAALVDGVAECLAAGERVAVPCSTKADARLIEAALLQRLQLQRRRIRPRRRLFARRPRRGRSAAPRRSA